jgi:hypothetical protein
MTFFRSAVEQMAKLGVVDSSDAKGELHAQCRHNPATALLGCCGCQVTALDRLSLYKRIVPGPIPRIGGSGWHDID